MEYVEYLDQKHTSEREKAENETKIQSVFGFNSFEEILKQYPNAVDLSNSDKRKLSYQEVTNYLKSIVNDVMVTYDGEKIAISDDFDHLEKSKDFAKLNRRGKEEIKTYVAEVEKLVSKAVFEKEIPNKDPAKVDVEKFKYYTVPVWINNRAYSVLLEYGQLKENRVFDSATRKGASNEHVHENSNEKHIRKGGKLQVLDISYLYNIRNRPLNNKIDSNDTYEYRKKIGLPVTKPLFYKDYEKAWKVKKFFILKEFDVSDYWAVLELYFENRKPVKIHSMFLKEMQSKKFKRTQMWEE